MQIVIDIDDSKLWEIKNEPIEKNFNIYELASYIDKGIPLPEGHGRLIDADALKETFIESNIYLKGNEKGFWCFTGKEIKNAPTIIEADKENKI